MRLSNNCVMIGKVFLTGKGFGETCQYLREERALSQVLDAEGVRPHDHKLMAEDFEWQHQLMPEKEKPVFHSVLSFPPGEVVPDERLVEIGREYMQKIGMVNTQYAFIKHSDKEHLHVHLVANRVNNEGRPIGKGLIIERSIKAAQELTQKYGLRQEQGKKLERTHREALHQPDAVRYRIYEAIRDQLPGCRHLDELEARLAERGITVRYRLDPGTGERSGISFRLDNRSFKGSRIDPEYSLGELGKTLVLQQRLYEERQRQELVEKQRRELEETQAERLRQRQVHRLGLHL
jgi:relaxase-like protein